MTATTRQTPLAPFALAVGALLLAGCTAGLPRGEAAEQAPSLPFYTDATIAAGLGGYLHAGYLDSTMPGRSAPFPEIMGPGACWLDMDG
ncbi:MAG: hypothetical protein ACPGQL_11385, partial [Thermoplasmatota archaeon]